MTDLPSDARIRMEAQRCLLEMQEFCRTRFGFGPEWKVFFKLDMNESRVKSRGGWHPRYGGAYVSLSLHRFRRPVSGFCEYARFRNHHVIGSVVTTDWKIYLAALCAHEIAHAVQFSLTRVTTSLALGDKTFQGLGKATSGHGDFFRRIYAILRRQFINHRLPAGSIGGQISSGVAEGVINVDTHWLSSRSFRHPKFGACTVIGKNNRSRKYPVIFQNAEGRLFKTTESDIARYFS